MIHPDLINPPLQWVKFDGRELPVWRREDGFYSTSDPATIQRLRENPILEIHQFSFGVWHIASTPDLAIVAVIVAELKADHQHFANSFSRAFSQLAE